MALLAPDTAERPSPVRIHTDLHQGTEEWIAARCGMLTASEMSLIVTPTFKPARNEKERSHLYELLAQRITGFVEPRYVSDDMLRGRDDEIEALALYCAPEWALLFEVGDATGARHTRFADAVAMSLWPSRGLELHGMEIKVSRYDWRSERKNPEKAETIAAYCDRWWLVTTPSRWPVGRDRTAAAA